VAGYTQADAEQRAALIEPGSYDVALDLTTGPGRFRSRTEIRFGCREPGAATFANLAAASVSGIRLNGRDLNPAEVLSGGFLHLDGLAADNLLTVDAEFGYDPDGHGLGWFTDPATGDEYVLATCFPDHAPRIFCCFDQPDLRSEFTLAVTAPAGWQCVSGGAVTARPADGEAGVWRFAPVPAARTFELAVCAGPYVTAAAPEPGEVAGISVRCRPALAGEPGVARVADLVRRLVEYYERLLQRPRPYPTYDIVFAPRLPASATQLPGIMLVSERFLQQAGDPGDPYPAGLLAHEVAHLWFGCQVEGRWWNDIWLGESLADYTGELAVTEGLGMTTDWARLGMSAKPESYRVDSVPGVRGVTTHADTVAEALYRSPSIVYMKGCCVVRQLAALIGDEALRAGLRDYLDRYSGSAAVTADLVGCWSRASGRDLSGWAADWLHAPGVNTLRPEVSLAPDGTVAALAVTQEPPVIGGPLRTHRIGIGGYVRVGGRLRRELALTAEISGSRTALPDLTGQPAPDAFVVNDGDLSFARTRFDGRSWRALAEVALDVSDPGTEAVCWSVAWDMTLAAELAAAGYVDLVTRRISVSPLPVSVAKLLAKAVTAADRYAPAGQRGPLRHRLAAAAAAARAAPGVSRRTRHELALAFAASADGGEQLARLRTWLDGAPGPAGGDGPAVDLILHRQILATLSAAGQAGDADLDAYAALDPVGGQANRLTCRALRPDPAAKQAAWAAALAPDQPEPLAVACAAGVWVPGQEDILAPFRERYFAEAWPVLRSRPGRIGPRLAHLLFPATLADPATIAATEAVLAAGPLADSLRETLAGQLVTLRQVLAARTKSWPA